MRFNDEKGKMKMQSMERVDGFVRMVQDDLVCGILGHAKMTSGS